MAVPADNIIAQMLTGGAAALKPATIKRMAATRPFLIPKWPKARATGAPTTKSETLPAPVSAPGMRMMIISTRRAIKRIL